MFKKILVSRYQLLKILGKGAFGKTYLAKDILLPGTPLCVVKKLNPTFQDDNSLTIARRLFDTEAESLQKLGEHPQIPRFLGFFEENNQFYLVQQFIEGHSLSKEITSTNIWSELKVIDLLRDCLNILKFIHAQNVIHRDIKPDNLIRNKQDNKLVLVDFGAVKEAISQSRIAQTIAIGTHGYMPSEQAMGKPRFNSDIYAVGIIAIQALTGLEALNFSQDNNGDIVWDGRENINPKLAKILSKMTRYHFKERYSSAVKVLKDLNSLEASYQVNNKNKFFNFNSLLFRFKNRQKNTVYEDYETGLTLPITPKKKTDYLKQRLPSTLINITFQGNFLKNLSFKKPLTMGIGSLATLGLVLGGVQIESHHKKQRIASLVTLMGANYERKEYDLCLNNAQIEARKIKVPNDTINSFIGKCTLGTAKKEAENENYSKAIAIATEIPQNNPFALEARENIDRWSQVMLDRATKIYEKEGQLTQVTPIIDDIPHNSPVKETALKLLGKWQAEISNNERILADADRAMTEKKWNEAIDRANKVKTVNNSIYWQEKADKIIAEAGENKAKELAAARQRRKVQKYNSYRRPSYQKPIVRQTTVNRQPKTSYSRHNRRVIRVRRRTIITRETRIIRRRSCRGSGCR